MTPSNLSRRQLLRLSAIAGTGAVLAACGAPAAPAAPTTAPKVEAPKEEVKPTEAPKEEVKPTEAPKEEVKPTEAPKEAAAPAGAVARNRTFIVNHGIGTKDVYNPWAGAGYTHQSGNALLWEPLFYFSLFANKEIPWLAESAAYNADFTELTIKMRKGAEWSDGTPITAKDVVFTLEGQKKNEKLQQHGAVAKYVKEVKATDDMTAVVTFNVPAPRFKFEWLSFKFDTGMPIVPAHVLSKEADVTAFLGTKEMPHSGPYSITEWNEDQKIYDVNKNWWAAKSGFQPLPAAERVIFLKLGTMEAAAQRVVNNECDACLDLRTELIKNTVKGNPKVTTHTGDKPPFGYLDWWPNSLWMNHDAEPYKDVKVRRAVSLAIDRPKLNEVLFDGAEVATIYPFPLYPNMQKFADSDGMKALVDKYQPGKYDLEESGKLMTEAGFTKNGDLWEKDGKPVPAAISGFESIHADIVPVLVEMLRAGGFDASIDFSPDSYNNMANGKPGLYMFGHGASLVDPFAVLELWSFAATGTTAGNNNFSRYKDPEFLKLVGEMSPLAADDPKFQELAVKAFDKYYGDVIDVPVIQWLHRIPMNQTYWTNYPTAQNPYLNGAYWHHTFPVMMVALKPAA